MKTKHALGLLVAIILSAGIAIAQQTPAQPQSPANPDDVLDQEFTFSLDGSGFLGVYAEDISKENMGRYNLNQVRGVGVTRIVKDSPAEKAGLRKDDVILRIDGETVTSVRKLNRVVSEIAPDQTVRVAISRGGAEQELSATMGRRNNSDAFQGLLRGNPGTWEWEGPSLNMGHDGPWTFAFAGSRRIGISTTALTKQLADYFGVAGGRGVLVTSVSEDGPAAKAGVKAGDVITAVDGETVDASGDISRVINRKKDGDVALTIIRNRSQQTIRVTPAEGGLHPGTTIGRPQIGRRIVIPRIQLGTIPEINIAMPRIELPTIPSINIEMPRIRVPTKVRVIRSANGPI
ncbi:MAG TPA: PDZ domain-containing protein [Pyrinomonadaceae bacterium]|jgi:serine protease Do|nr:PDZ domain-containing protein [Pyrinomonadaceae bacterium]